MAWPIKSTFKADDPVASVSADWHNTVANVLNDITGVGCAIEKTPHGLGWRVIVDNSYFETTQGSGHRFKPTLDSTGTTVSISQGSWTGYDDTATVSNSATGLGDSVNKYIVATVDTQVAPTSLTLADTNVLPVDSDHQTKRLITTLTYDTDGQISNIDKATVGDIHNERQITKLSLGYTDSGDLQQAGWQGASDTDIAPGDLISFKDITDSDQDYITFAHFEASLTYSGIGDAPDTTTPWPIAPDSTSGMQHEDLDNRENDTDSHPALYMLLGDTIAATSTRNAMVGVIGDSANTVSIAPNTRILSDTAGAASVSYGAHTLDGAPWTATDTTVAGSGVGALLVPNGGIYAGKGGYFKGETGSAFAVWAENAGGNRFAYFCDDADSIVAFFDDQITGGSMSVLYHDGAAFWGIEVDRAISITAAGESYWHAASEGITTTVQVTQAGVTKDMHISGGIIVGLT